VPDVLQEVKGEGHPANVLVAALLGAATLGQTTDNSAAEGQEMK